MNQRYNVLCVGVNHARLEGSDPLRFAEKDARCMAEHFETLKKKADVKITRLTGAQATRKGIFDWLDHCNSLWEEQTVFIFFAGHGSAQKNDKKKSLERCLWIDGSDDDPEEHKITTSEIMARLSNPAHRLVFVIDACYNFGSKQNISIKDISRQFRESERGANLGHYVIISASAVRITALEDPYLGHGVLAYYFLKTISGKYSFFLETKLSAFKLLAILDKKVRNHRFVTDTGRKRPLSMLMENGLMVHWNDRNFSLPVLENGPIISGKGIKPLQYKLVRWGGFFLRTRLRIRLFFTIGLLLAVLVLAVLSHAGIVNVQFDNKRYARFNHLFGYSGFSLDKLKGEMIRPNGSPQGNFFLFESNWTDALRRELDDNGRIVLNGHLLGQPIGQVDEKKLVRFALRNGDNIFFWHKSDVSRLLGALKRQYEAFPNDKLRMIQLLALLGENGADAAGYVFDLKNETNRRLNDEFLKLFYTPEFLEANYHELDLNDWLRLIRLKKQIRFPSNHRVQEKIQSHLNSILQKFPHAGSTRPVTDTDKVSELYQYLELLAFFGSPHFQEKAAIVFENAFIPGEALQLIQRCKYFDHGVWVLEYYFDYLRCGGLPEMPWEHWQVIERAVDELPLPQKSRFRKRIVDNHFQMIPKDRNDYFLWDLRESDPTIIVLNDWKRWLKQGLVSPYLTLVSVISMKYPGLFQYLISNYDEFRGRFSDASLEALAGLNKTEALRLAERLFPGAVPKDKLNFAVFLYYNDQPGYSDYIGEFLRESENDEIKLKILLDFHDRMLHSTLIRIVRTDKTLKNEIRHFIRDRKLFYRFFPVVLEFWPNEAVSTILRTSIPHGFPRGIDLLRVCEKLPQTEKKHMLLKLCRSAGDETYKLNVETSLAKHFPGDYLKEIEKRTYRWYRSTGEHVVDAYRTFPFNTLRRKLVLLFNTGRYWKIGYICEALIKKESDKQIGMEDLRDLLEEFHRPVERVLLRTLRYHVNKHDYGKVGP